jgi:hypothetical protein
MCLEKKKMHNFYNPGFFFFFQLYTTSSTTQTHILFHSTSNTGHNMVEWYFSHRG